MIESQPRRPATGAEMPVLIDVEDKDWKRVPELEDLAERAVSATLAYMKRPIDQLEVSILFTGDEEAAGMVRRSYRNGHWAVPKNV